MHYIIKKLSDFINQRKYVLKSDLFKNISYLTIGRVITQVISIVGAFYIPKLLGTENYGVYQTVLNYVNIFLFFTLLGFDKVAIREASKDKKSTKKIIESILGLKYLSTITGIVLSIVLLIFIDYEISTKIYIAIFSISLIFRGLEKSLFNIYIVNEKMKIIAIFEMFRTILVVLTTIILLKLNYGLFTVITSNLCIIILITSINYIYSKKYFTIKLFPKIRIIKKFIKSGINFSLINLLNILSSRIDIFMLSLLTTPDNVGIYALAFKMFAKIRMLRNSISQALFPNYSNKYKNNTLVKGILVKHSSYMLILSIFMILFVNIVSKPVVVNLIGTEYRESVTLINLLVFNLALILTGNPWSTYLQVSNNEKFLIYSGIMRASTHIIFNYIFFKLFGLVGVVYSTILSSFISFFFILFIVNRKFKKQP